MYHKMFFLEPYNMSKRVCLINYPLEITTYNFTQKYRPLFKSESQIYQVTMNKHSNQNDLNIFKNIC